MQNNRGIIYMVQPVELIGTERYKIGYSKTPTINRVLTGYNKGTRYLYIEECKNPSQIEKIIKKEFKNKFKLIGGSEYFEGDEIEIKKKFRMIVDRLNIEKNNIQNDALNNVKDNVENNVEGNVKDKFIDNIDELIKFCLGHNVKSLDDYYKLCNEYDFLPDKPKEVYNIFKNIDIELGCKGNRC